MMYIVQLAVILVTAFFPAWLQILLFALNLFIPDPIPFVDEIIQAVIIIKTLSHE